MSPYTFLKCQNKKIITQVVNRAGTSFEWFGHIARGHGKCSVELAVALEEASLYYSLSDNDAMSAEEILGLNDIRVARKKEMMKKK